MQKKGNSKELEKAREKGSKFLGEFKSFVLKGNVMDLAVGVLIGASFQGLVNSFTTNIISPVLGCLTEANFNQYTLHIGNLYLTYGAFITDVINFVIMAFVIFVLVKSMNILEHLGKKPEKKEEPKRKSNEEVLLEEIRDLLKKQKGE